MFFLFFYIAISSIVSIIKTNRFIKINWFVKTNKGTIILYNNFFLDDVLHKYNTTYAKTIDVTHCLGIICVSLNYISSFIIKKKIKTKEKQKKKTKRKKKEKKIKESKKVKF